MDCSRCDWWTGPKFWHLIGARCPTLGVEPPPSKRFWLLQENGKGAFFFENDVVLGCLGVLRCGFGHACGRCLFVCVVFMLWLRFLLVVVVFCCFLLFFVVFCCFSGFGIGCGEFWGVVLGFGCDRLGSRLGGLGLYAWWVVLGHGGGKKTFLW